MMKTNKRYMTAFLGSLSAAAILSGVAVAGNPHGAPPGQAKKQSGVSASASASASTSAGVKPSATTNSTHNSSALAASNQTKLYGNGKTAGQIAMQNGAGASASLYGPGNSQPHKASLCANGKTHLVDVHALKAHSGAGACVAGSVSSTSSTSSSNASASASSSASLHSNGKGVGVGAKASPGKNTKGAFTPPRSSNSSGGVSAASVSAKAKPARPVTSAANFTG